MNSEYLHVSQFYEAILCFSLLSLIVQKIIILWKNLNDQYLKSRANQFDDQTDWKKAFQVEKQMKQVNKQQQKIKEENQAKNIEYKRQTLKTSLIDNNQSHQTDKSLIQGQQQPKRLQQQKVMQVQFTNNDQSIQSKQFQNQKISQQKKIENDQKKPRYGDQIQEEKHVKVQNQNQIKENKVKMEVINNQLQVQMKNEQVQKRREKCQDQQSQLAQQDVLQKQYKDKQKTRYFKRIDSLFNQYFSIIIPVLVLGILLHSTYIFTMVCFFGFIFSSLLFNYANLLSKLKSQPSEDSIFIKTNKLISGVFVIALFISYWSDNQYQ